MTHTEWTNELGNYSVPELLEIIDAALDLVRQELRGAAEPESIRETELAAAAEALLQDYVNDTELTAFSVLDAEDFYA